MTTSASFDLAGRVALVTGGNGGIGRGIALGFAGAGAAVAILGRNAEKNARVLDELRATGVRCMAVAVDVTDRPALEPAFRSVEAELGPVDILVNNAGIASVSGGILQESAESWDNVIETQLNAVFLLSKIAAGSMARRKRGKIINIASMYSYFGSGLVPSYRAAKGAIVQLTKSMAIELAPHGIQVNALAPGWIETDMTAALPGSSNDLPPHKLDAAIIFAPAGPLIPQALRTVGKGGTVVCGGIHMSDIPSFPYSFLWEERTVTSVANLTRRDGEEFMALEPKVPVRTEVRRYPLDAANEALHQLRTGKLNGAAVLTTAAARTAKN